MSEGRVVVVGSGTIGASLALICSIHGWTTCLLGRSNKSLDAARTRVHKAFKELESAELVPANHSQGVDLLEYSTDLQKECAQADFVLEAINEDVCLKQEIFSSIEKAVPETAILASSTSGLPVDDIALLCERKQRIAVVHFANPPHLMPTVEVVPGSHTSPKIMSKLCSFVESLNKTAIRLKKDLPGHLFNRIQYAMLREVMALVRDDVASAEDIDNVVKQGLALRLAAEGPLQKMDLAGLDLVNSVSEYLFPELDASKEPDYLRQLLSKNHHGSINGLGFYDWTEEEANAVIDERNQEVVRHLKRLGRLEKK
jgi:3-hydroxybutyryl-CoA dehydrogenase